MQKILSRYFSTFILIILTVAFILRFWQLDLPDRYLFDEDFFAYTAGLMAKNDSSAFEWWHGPLDEVRSEYLYRPPAVEWLHPPLSKQLMSVSIRLFGDTPFAWRFPSAASGTLLVLLVIGLAQSLFHRHEISLLAGLFASFEHLLVVQSRIAAPDIFVACGAVLLGLCFWQWSTHRTKKWLIASGVALGLTATTKWSGIFILPGLLLFEFIRLGREKNLVAGKRLMSLVKTTAMLLIIGAVVYVASFSQLFLQGHNFTYFIELHHQIWQYQTTAQFSHPASSKPWEWLIGQKPIWYAVAGADSSLRDIVAQPTIWLLGLSETALVSTFITLLKLKKSKRKNMGPSATLFLVLLIISEFVPWLLVRRPTFLYHFTPIMPFLLIVLAHSTMGIISQIKKPTA
ncbi:glycosyltransferase family 39 protein [Candidatus Woesebacteria bacterium]|nr:glycosyltransferase family 39 protein [Candidatus Woesebacteria bacterium]